MSGGGKNPLYESDGKAAAALRDGCQQRFLQLLHATYKAGWWGDEEGGNASFVKICEQILPAAGVTSGYVRQRLNKAYNQGNWYQVVEEIDLAVRNYKKQMK